jgi:hypothetical protein
MEQETLGIAPIFWKDEPQEDSRNVLPMIQAQSAHPSNQHTNN